MELEVIKTSSGINIYTNTALNKLKESANTLKIIREELLKAAIPGSSTIIINKLAESLFKKYECKPLFKGYQGYPFATCISNNEDIVHGFPNNRKLQIGDVISIDLGVRHKNGFCSDSARTIVVGMDLTDSPHYGLIEVAKDAFYKGLSLANPGNTTCDVGHAIFGEIVDKGREEKASGRVGYKIFTRFQGHGIGLDLHENPPVPNWGKPGLGTKLKSGMCICIEPVVMYNSSEVLELSVRGVKQFKTSDKLPTSHYENQVYISEDGPIVLT